MLYIKTLKFFLIRVSNTMLIKSDEDRLLALDLIRKAFNYS